MNIRYRLCTVLPPRSIASKSRSLRYRISPSVLSERLHATFARFMGNAPRHARSISDKCTPFAKCVCAWRKIKAFTISILCTYTGTEYVCVQKDFTGGAPSFDLATGPENRRSTILYLTLSSYSYKIITADS